MLGESLRNIIDAIWDNVHEADEVLRRRDEVREHVIRISRDIIRESGYVVTSIHNEKIDEASQHLEKLNELFKEFSSILRNFPELRFTGLVFNAESEYVEARILYDIVVHGKAPSIAELSADPVSYLQGLLDVVGELKRLTLESVSKKDFHTAMNYFKIAEGIYEAVRPLDYPEALLPGVRRKTDIARAVVESLRSLLTDLKFRKELLDALESCREASRDT